MQKKLKYGSVQPYQGIYKEGDEIVVSCNTGFFLSGSSKVSCSKDGRWSAELPHCKGLYYVFLCF